MGTQTQTQTQTQKTVLSYDQVSKFFSLPLSDAADALAVCRSDLKKICYDNGLVRWPYRKILSGKSIEEIKMDAARERNKELAEFLKATGERNDASASSATSLSPGSQIQSKSSTSLLDMSNSRGVSKQQGSKNSPNGMPSDLQSSNLTNGTPASLDEFKYGFPSDGLSTASNKWWGGSSALDGEHDFHGVLGADIQAEEHQSKEKSVSAESSLLGKSDSRMDHSDVGPQGTGILTAVRKRALEEGRALKLGLYRYGGMKKLGRRERVLLRGIFKSSLPSRCDTWF